MNVLSNNKQQELKILFESGKYSHRQMAKLLGVNRETVSRYAVNSRKVENQPGVSTDSCPKTSHPYPPSAEASACILHGDWIARQVELGRNAVSIYQELVDTKGFTSKYSSVKRFVRKLKKVKPEIFDILSFAPGEEVQVDYGQGAPTLHAQTGKYRRPRLFVMTLRYSRRSFRKVVWKSSAEIWAKLHEEAFRYFGGTPKFAVLDNLKEGVVKPDIYDPELNKTYAACLGHYKVIADPCRVRDPNRKGCVESAIKHTQDTALKGKRFESIEEQNEFLKNWEERWAARRIHGSAKRQVAAMFEEEKPFLNSLPIESFQFFKEEIRTVDDAATVTVDKVRYTANPALPYSKVAVRIFEREVEIYDTKTHALLRRHSRSFQPGSVVIEEKDRIFNPSRNTKYAISLASEIGSNTKKLCEILFTKEGRIAHKSIFAVVSLAEKYGNTVVENAARISCERERFRYSEIKRLVQNLVVGEKYAKDANTDKDQLIQKSKLIRPAIEYSKFFKNHCNKNGVKNADELN